MSRTITLGVVTAYADAVEAGYTGTQEEFAQDLANAATYAATSAQAKIDAEAAAGTATTKAGEAATSAGSAADDADDAHSDALAALSYKETAEGAATTATTKAGEAANSASQASNSAGAAAASATAASGSAGAASTSAGQASTSATTSTTQALKSEGYAVGKQNGTDVAEGSDYYHNNAKYYSEQAAAQLPLVTAEGTRQIGLVDAKGDEVLASIPADYTTLSNDVDDLKSDLTDIGVPIKLPALYEDSKYSNPLTGASFVSDKIISANSFIAKVSIKSGSAYNNGRLYIISENDKKCLYTKVISGTSGWNEIDVGYLCEEDARIGIYGANVLYTNSAVDADHAFCTNGLTSANPLAPTVGETVTLSKLYSGNFALQLEWELVDSYIKQILVNENDIYALQENVSNINDELEELNSVTRNPSLYSVETYTDDYTGASALSDIVISPGSYVESVSFFSYSETSGTVFIIRTSDNKCVFSKRINRTNVGINEVGIGIKIESECRFGFYGLGIKYKSSAVDAAHRFSVGINRTEPYIPSVDDTVSITHVYSGNFAMSIQWVMYSEIKGEIVNNKRKIAALERGKIYDHTGIVSFIDDDTGKYVPEIWGEILTASPMRMGFACVTGFMSGQETPPEIYEQMTLAELQSLYNDGHEVYSHSYSHPDFASVSITLPEIERQCRLSKQWLDSNGFMRNSDIIVYPGGMGQNKTDRQDVVRQFYKYGVDTVGGGINPEPIDNPWAIYRFNADTATLQELKDKVDIALSERKLLVFMNHAYQLKLDKANQVAKMIAIIDYIKAQSGLILPFGEAMHRIYGWK